MKSTVHKILFALSTVIALAMAPAQAAVIVGSFDPAYGGGFTNMGWRGSITLSVPNSCLASDGTFNTVACPDMQTVSSQVQLYQLDNPTTFGSIDYSGSPFLSTIQVSGGHVTGFATFGCFECGTYGPAPSGLDFAPGYDQFSYGLAFDLAAPVVQLYAAIYKNDINADVAKILFTDSYNPFDDDFAAASSHLAANCRRVFGDGGVYYECASTGVAKLTITEVPEPGSAALLLGALGLLGLLGWARQRRQVPRR